MAFAYKEHASNRVTRAAIRPYLQSLPKRSPGETGLRLHVLRRNQTCRQIVHAYSIYVYVYRCMHAIHGSRCCTASIHYDAPALGQAGRGAFVAKSALPATMQCNQAWQSAHTVITTLVMICTRACNYGFASSWWLSTYTFTQLASFPRSSSLTCISCTSQAKPPCPGPGKSDVADGATSPANCHCLDVAIILL